MNGTHNSYAIPLRCTIFSYFAKGRVDLGESLHTVQLIPARKEENELVGSGAAKKYDFLSITNLQKIRCRLR